MNMSASILRNIVSSVFGVKPQNVILSGTIEPETTWHFDSGVSYVKGHDDAKVYGFSAKRGFEELTEKVVGYTHYYNGNHDHDQDTTCAKMNLAEASKEKDYIFYVVNTFGASSFDGEEYNDFTLYKAPDFAAHWAAIEKEDAKRWEEWLNA
jgi:hypothetical protein